MGPGVGKKEVDGGEESVGPVDGCDDALGWEEVVGLAVGNASIRAMGPLMVSTAHLFTRCHCQ